MKINLYPITYLAHQIGNGIKLWRSIKQDLVITKIFQVLDIWALLNPLSKTGKCMPQLETYQNKSIYLNWQTRQGEATKRPSVTLGELKRSRWEYLCTGQLLVMHFTKLAFIKEWLKDIHVERKLWEVLLTVYHMPCGRHSKHIEEGALVRWDQNSTFWH